MRRLCSALFVFRVLGYVLFRPVGDFIDQAVLGRSPLNPADEQ